MRLSTRDLLSLAVLCLLSAPILAIEFSSDAYDVYIGDVNGDGRSDFYFQGKQLLINSVLVTPKNCVIFQSDDGYESSINHNISASSLVNYVANGRFRKAVISNVELGQSVDALYWYDSAGGFTKLLIRGADVYDASILLATYSNVDLPLIINELHANSPSLPNFSNKNLIFLLKDSNADGRLDLVSGSAVVLTDYNGMLVAKVVTTSVSSASPVTQSIFYDELGRLERIESTDGATQEFGMDAENNRTSDSQIKGN